MASLPGAMCRISASRKFAMTYHLPVSSNENPSPDLRDSTYFVRADGRKNLGQDPALQVTRVRDGAKTRKAAASRLRRNSKAPSALISPTEFVERAELKSSASFEIQLLLPAMFQVSVSWVEIPFVGGGIRISNASKAPKS